MKEHGPMASAEDEPSQEAQINTIKFDFTQIDAIANDIFPEHVLPLLDHAEYLSFGTVSKKANTSVHKSHTYRDKERRLWLKNLQTPLIFASHYACFAVGYDNSIRIFANSSYYFKFQKSMDFFKDKAPIIQIAGGQEHVLILTCDGQVYAWGENAHGQLGLGHEIDIPTKIDFFDDIPLKQIAAGHSHSLFLTRDGQVYSCGKNSSGQLGLGHYNNVDIRTKIDFFNNMVISQISAGDDHSLFQSDKGKVFSCGNNDHGELGLEHFSSVNIPTQIPSLKDSAVTLIAAGQDFSYFYTIDKRLFSCGNNDRGQLGFENPNFFINYFNFPIQIDFFNDKPLKNVVAGKFQQAFFQTEDGCLYSCGCNYQGELGLGNKSAYWVYTPQKITHFKKNEILQVACGDNTIFLDKDGDVYLCGPGNPKKAKGYWKTFFHWNNIPKHVASLLEPNITKVAAIKETEEKSNASRFKLF